MVLFLLHWVVVVMMIVVVMQRMRWVAGGVGLCHQGLEVLLVTYFSHMPVPLSLLKQYILVESNGFLS